MVSSSVAAASAVVSVVYKAEHVVGSGLPVGGAYRETWTHGSCDGVDRLYVVEAERELAGYRGMAERHGDAICSIVEDAYCGKTTVTLPGALDLQYVYYLPV